MQPSAWGGCGLPLFGFWPKSESFEIVFWQASDLRDRTAKIAEAVTAAARAPGAIVRKAKSFVIAQRAQVATPAIFAVLDLLVLLDQAKSTEKEF
ncbi:MAG: hypothetical protein ACLTSJ_08640 [Alistipes communis]